MSIAEYKKHLAAFKNSKDWADLIKNLSQIEQDILVLFDQRNTKLQKLYLKLSNTTEDNEKYILKEIEQTFVNESNCRIKDDVLVDPALFIVEEMNIDALLKEKYKPCDYLYKLIKEFRSMFDRGSSSQLNPSNSSGSTNVSSNRFKITLAPHSISQFRSSMPSANYLIRRLTQCMNEHLPSGVHIKVLKIYNLLLNSGDPIRENLNSKSKYDICLFTGLFNYGRIAKMSAKQNFLTTMFYFTSFLHTYESEYVKNLNTEISKICKLTNIHESTLCIKYSSNIYLYTPFILLAIFPLLHSSFEIDNSLVQQIKGKSEETEISFMKRCSLFGQTEGGLKEDSKKAIIISFLYLNNPEFYSCFYRILLNETTRIGALKILKECISLEQQRLLKEENYTLKYISPYMLPAIESCLNDEDGFVQKGAFELLTLILSSNSKYKLKTADSEISIPFTKLNKDLVLNSYRFLCIKLDCKEHSTIQRIIKLLDREVLFELFYKHLIKTEDFQVFDYFTTVIIKTMATYSLYRDESAAEDDLNYTCNCGNLDNLIAFCEGQESICTLKNSLYLRHSGLNVYSFVPLLMLGTTLNRHVSDKKPIQSVSVTNSRIVKTDEEFNKDNQMTVLIASLGEEYVEREIIAYFTWIYKKYSGVNTDSSDQNLRKEIIIAVNKMLKALTRNVLSNVFSNATYLNMLIFFSILQQTNLRQTIEQDAKKSFLDQSLFTELIIYLANHAKDTLFTALPITGIREDILIDILLYLKTEDVSRIETLYKSTSIEQIIFNLIFSETTVYLKTKYRIKLFSFFAQKTMHLTNGKSIHETLLSELSEEALFNKTSPLIKELFYLQKFRVLTELLNSIDKKDIIFSYIFKLTIKEFGKKRQNKKKLLRFILNIKESTFCIFYRKYVQKLIKKGLKYKQLINIIKILKIIFEEQERGSEYRILLTTTADNDEDKEFIKMNSYIMTSHIFRVVPILNLLSVFILTTTDTRMEVKYFSFINILSNVNVLIRVIEYSFMSLRMEGHKSVLEKVTKYSRLFVMISHLCRNLAFLGNLKRINLFDIKKEGGETCLIIDRLIMYLIYSTSKTPCKNDEHNIEKKKQADKLMKEKLHIMTASQLLLYLCTNNILNVSTLLEIIDTKVSRTQNSIQIEENINEERIILKKGVNFIKHTLKHINPSSPVYLKIKTDLTLPKDLKNLFMKIDFDKIKTNSKLIKSLGLAENVLLRLTGNRETEIYHKIYCLLVETLISLYNKGIVEISGGVEKAYEYKYSELNTYNELKSETDFGVVITKEPLYFSHQSPSPDNKSDKETLSKYSGNKVSMNHEQATYTKIDKNKIIRREDSNNLNMNFPLTNKIQFTDQFPFIRKDRTCFIEIYELTVKIYYLLIKQSTILGLEFNAEVWKKNVQSKNLTENLFIFFPTDHYFNSVIQTSAVDLFPTCYLINNYKLLNKLIVEKKIINFKNALRFIYRILVMQRIKSKEYSFNSYVKFQALNISTNFLQNIKELSAIECVCCDAITANIIDCDVLLIAELSEIIKIDPTKLRNLSNLYGTRISIYEQGINKLLSNGDAVIQESSTDEKLAISSVIKYETNLRIFSYFIEHIKFKYANRLCIFNKFDSNFTLFDNLKSLKGCEYNWYARTTKESYILLKRGSVYTKDIYLNICQNTQTCTFNCSSHYGFVKETKNIKVIKRIPLNIELKTNISLDCTLINKKREIGLNILHKEGIQKLYSLSILKNEKIDYTPMFGFYFSNENAILLKSKCLKRISLVLLANQKDTYVNELKHLIRIISEGYKWTPDNYTDPTSSTGECNKWDLIVNNMNEDTALNTLNYCKDDCTCLANKPDIYINTSNGTKNSSCHIKMISKNFKIPNTPNLLASILVLIRVMILRFSADRITNLWPVFYEMFFDILQNIIKDSPALEIYRLTGYITINEELGEDFILKTVDWQVLAELIKTLDVILIKGDEIEHKLLVSGQMPNFYLNIKQERLPQLNTSSLFEILRIGLFNSNKIDCVNPFKRTLLIRNLTDVKQMSLYMQVAEDYYRKVEMLGYGEDRIVHFELRDNKAVFEKEDEEITRVVCLGIEEFDENI
ncbi:hypothetical protein CDIK_1278 [Cucumispora dikerogammari]|nr:hypothetical protein CDIK_1278 [Cucumispora dikerogammari]